MTPLPPPLGAGELVAWRLDEAVHAPTWDSGEGAYRDGGRVADESTQAEGDTAGRITRDAGSPV